MTGRDVLVVTHPPFEGGVPAKARILCSQLRRRAPWRGKRPLLLFVGDGEMRAEFEAGAEDDVHFLGFRNQAERPAFYALADVFVLASEREPWGLAVNEAMACGTAAVVSGQVGCAADLVSDDCGAVVPAGDVDAVAAALADVVERSEAAGKAAATRMRDWEFEADVAGLAARARLVSTGAWRRM